MKLMKAYAADFWRYRFLLQNLIGRDFKLKYRRSVLGVVWSVLNPLLMCLVMWVVFSSIFNQKGGGIENFPVYLMCGQLLFNFFNEATNVAMGSVLGAGPLIKKIYIPKYLFPLEKVCFALVNCLFSFIALAIVMLLTGAKLHATIFLAIYPLLTLFVFSLGVGLALAAATVFFRDIMHLWGVFCTIVMYFSALFYNPLSIGADLGNTGALLLQSVIRFNPVYWYITAFRVTVLDGQVLTTNMLLICGGCALVSLVFGLLVFRRQQDKFVLFL